MSKSKVVSSAVAKAVEAAVPVVAPVVKTRGPKQHNAEDYYREYMVSVAAEETWEQLCARTGFSRNNVVQAIGSLRSEVRAAAEAQAATPGRITLCQKLKITPVEWVDSVVEKKVPYLSGDGTRNTVKARLVSSLCNFDE